MALEITHLTPKIGTAIKADIVTLLSGSESANIRQILEQRGIVVFPQIHMSDPQQTAFAATLGDVLPQGDEGILKVTLDTKLNPKADYIRGAFFWHIDGANDAVPARASLLSAQVLPQQGGDTEFANTYAAYDELPETEKKALEGLKVVHSLEESQRYVIPEPDYAELQAWQSVGHKSHPLVWAHRSGRKSLVLGASASHVEGMSLEKGRALLCRLRDWATQRQFVYRHHWNLDDLVIWDNTGTMHRVLHYALQSGRLMHRTTLMGEEALV